MNKKNVLTIRIPEDLKDRIEKTAAAQGVSLNQFALYAFTRGLNDINTSNFLQISNQKSGERYFHIESRPLRGAFCKAKSLTISYLSKCI